MESQKFMEELQNLKMSGPDMISTQKRHESSVCPKCKGTFWIINKEGFAMRCECWRLEKQRRILKFANIPEKYKDASFENYRTDIYGMPDKMELVKRACMSYAKEYKAGVKGLYLSSMTKGSGKTRMAATIGNTLMKNGFGVKFATSSSIIEEIKKTWKKASEYSESQLIDDLVLTEVLIIDDFGAEMPRDWVNDKFYYIINERYINNRTTIFTSNYKLAELEYDSRIANRIQEICYLIPFLEESIREKQAAENVKEVIQLLRE